MKLRKKIYNAIFKKNTIDIFINNGLNEICMFKNLMLQKRNSKLTFMRFFVISCIEIYHNYHQNTKLEKIGLFGFCTILDIPFCVKYINEKFNQDKFKEREILNSIIFCEIVFIAYILFI